MKLLVLAVLLASCTRVVYLEKPEPTPYVVIGDWPLCHEGHPCTWAQTACAEDNRPVVLVRKDFVPDGAFVFTKVHEEVHIAQMSKDCKGTMRRYVDSMAVRVRMESEAYCAEARARLKATQDVKRTADWFAYMMWQLFEIEEATCNLKPP